MNEAILIHLTTQVLWIVMLLSLPVVAAVTVVSLIVSVLQTLTQLQDQTMQFIFKLVTTAVVLSIGYRWMGLTLLHYSELAFSQLSMIRR
ncbi:Secretion system apparatus protein ssaS [Candidatus Glomeribacter gigasporarum BEG34]|uniref:Secretion system apparatus protein ssaS n=1 Tax=Candidatus Glomeribacter gigasporarum BEG34 TaxID=1070319 RepID=G2J8X5_9BURK|nr:type III secretion system export apparatus subunit SctS [Candidatus Glomeribacter gigasporarum]CCD29222.1 Secretion system apparatus protein ssaS [Candidatus Glomeribacter gigasporarum BEG34]